MKKNIYLIVFSLIFCLQLYSQRASYPNPAAVYCEKMGYQYINEKDEQGNSIDYCILPDSSKVNAWDFFKGKIKPEYSYCERKGYSLITKTIIKNGFVIQCPFCQNNKKNTKGTNDSSFSDFIEIEMNELMKINGEPLINNVIDTIPKIPKPNINNNLKPKNQFKALKNFPSSFDWRNYNGHSYIGGVRNQGNCGACYAFGAVACAEGVYNKATDAYDSQRKEFSESFIVWCLGSLTEYKDNFSGCQGADYEYMELEALTNQGVCELSCFPYTIYKPATCTHWNDAKAVFSSWQRVNCGDIDGIKTAIMSYGVVDAAIYVDDDFFLYENGVYSDALTSCPNCEYTPTNHAIALVGWGYDESQGEYWILRNSWGSSWGESGYMRISTSAARVACEVAYLLPNPLIYDADYISDSNIIPSLSNVEYIAHNSINFTTGFKVEYGANFKASIQSRAQTPPTIIPIKEFDKLKYFSLNQIKTTFELNQNNSIKNQNDDKTNTFSVYPNPVVDFINITDIDLQSIISIKLYDSKGSLINCIINKSMLPIIIDVSNLSSGLYVIHLKTNNDLYIKKIIKN